MLGHRFNKYDPNEGEKSRFEQLLDLFMQMLSYTNGDVGEAMQWMNELDKKYQLTDDEYGMGDLPQTPNPKPQTPNPMIRFT